MIALFRLTKVSACGRLGEESSFLPEDSARSTGIGRLSHLDEPRRFKAPTSRESGEARVRGQASYGLHFERHSEVLSGDGCQEKL